MEFDNRSVPLAKEPEIAPIRTDDPEYYWTALLVLVILSVVIMVLLYNHDIQDPGYSHWNRKYCPWQGNSGQFHFFKIVRGSSAGAVWSPDRYFNLGVEVCCQDSLPTNGARWFWCRTSSATLDPVDSFTSNTWPEHEWCFVIESSSMILVLLYPDAIGLHGFLALDNFLTAWLVVEFVSAVTEAHRNRRLHPLRSNNLVESCIGSWHLSGSRNQL